MTDQPAIPSATGLYDVFWLDTRDNTTHSECGGLSWHEATELVARDHQDAPFFTGHDIREHFGRSPVRLTLDHPLLNP